MKRKNQKPSDRAIDCAKKVIRRLKKAGQPFPSQAALAVALEQSFFHEHGETLDHAEESAKLFFERWEERKKLDNERGDDW